MSEENENPTNTTNGTITEEQYNQLKGELEAERAKVTEQVREATQPLTERITSLEEQLRGKTEEAEQHRTAAEEKDRTFASLSAQHEGAVGAYRDLVLRSNPLLPADMITGGTIEEVNASVEKASGLIDSVKKGLESIYTPAGSGFAQHPVIWNFIVQIISGKPKPIKPLGICIDQLPYIIDAPIISQLV